MTQIFDELPPVLFDSIAQYKMIRNELVYKLGLDYQTFGMEDESIELCKKCETPSPIRRIEDSLFFNNGLNLSNFDVNSVLGEYSCLMSQDENSQFLVNRSASALSTKKLQFNSSRSQVNLVNPSLSKKATQDSIPKSFLGVSKGKNTK